MACSKFTIRSRISQNLRRVLKQKVNDKMRILRRRRIMRLKGPKIPKITIPSTSNNKNSSILIN